MRHVSLEPSSIGLRAAGILSFVGIFSVNAMGFVDHDTKSGMGCGANWPLCRGSVIPAFSNEAVVIEFVHRLLTVGFVIALVVFFVGMIRHSRYSRSWARMTRGLVMLLVAETIICTAGVLWNVPNAIMAWLAAVGLAAQGVLLVMVLRMWRPEPRINPSHDTDVMGQWLRGVVVVIMTVYLYVGAWLSYTPPRVFSLSLYYGSGSLLALSAIVWMWYQLRSSKKYSMIALMLPLILTPFISRFSFHTVAQDLEVFVWLSWCTGIVSYHVFGDGASYEARTCKINVMRRTS